MPLTKVILTENIPGLGAEADVVKVRRGYARNYLLPHGKAYEVTAGALRQLDSLKQKRAEREARELNEAEELARRIGKASVHLHAGDRRDRQGIWIRYRAGYYEPRQKRTRRRD
jgi:ribosomal protein L9